MKLFEIERVLASASHCGVNLVRMEFTGNRTDFKFWFSECIFDVNQIVEGAIRDYWKAITGAEIGEIRVDPVGYDDDVYGMAVHVTIFDKEP